VQPAMLNNTSLLTPEKEEFSGAIIPFRHQILQQLLENKEGLNICELTNYLNISRAAVQKHFNVLEREGLIAKHKRVKTLGRPTTNYVLTKQGLAYFPKRYNLLLELVLGELNHDLTSDQITVLMQKLGKKLADQYRPCVEDKEDSERVAILFNLMHELGFQVVMQHNVETQSVEIHAHNCIYHDVAQQFQEICTLDQTLIEELMNKKIELRSCMAKGDGACCFRMPPETE
jgi:DeoR family transcriptional regulator, suf operon transcriptional repressor